jgi:hypothetical protein
MNDIVNSIGTDTRIASAAVIKYNEWNESVVMSTHDSHPLLLPCYALLEKLAPLIQSIWSLCSAALSKTADARQGPQAPSLFSPPCPQAARCVVIQPAAIDTHKEEERGSTARIK